MDFIKELHDARDLVEWCFRECGLNPSDHITMVEWNHRFTRRMGDASMRTTRWGGKTRRIRLSAPLWPRATAEERRQTVIHEACHIIDGVINGSMSGHKEPWKRLMRKCGLQPKRCHNVNREGIRRRNKREAASCHCGAVDSLGSTQAGRLRKGTRYSCRKCKSQITLV